MREATRAAVCATCGLAGQVTASWEDPVYCPGCAQARLKPGQRYATCQVCGARGIEDESDPAPSICPDCLEAQLRADLVRRST